VKRRLALCIVGALVVPPILSSCAVSGVSSNEAQWDRARMACEQVGLKPGSAEVSDCAAGLRNALTNVSL